MEQYIAYQFPDVHKEQMYESFIQSAEMIVFDLTLAERMKEYPVKLSSYNADILYHYALDELEDAELTQNGDWGYGTDQRFCHPDNTASIIIGKLSNDTIQTEVEEVTVGFTSEQISFLGKVIAEHYWYNSEVFDDVVISETAQAYAQLVDRFLLQGGKVDSMHRDHFLDLAALPVGDFPFGTS